MIGAETGDRRQVAQAQLDRQLGFDVVQHSTSDRGGEAVLGRRHRGCPAPDLPEAFHSEQREQRLKVEWPPLLLCFQIVVQDPVQMLRGGRADLETRHQLPGLIAEQLLGEFREALRPDGHHEVGTGFGHAGLGKRSVGVEVEIPGLTANRLKPVGIDREVADNTTAGGHQQGGPLAALGNVGEQVMLANSEAGRRPKLGRRERRAGGLEENDLPPARGRVLSAFRTSLVSLPQWPQRPSAAAVSGALGRPAG
jgi:hypothetical protein